MSASGDYSTSTTLKMRKKDSRAEANQPPLLYKVHTLALSELPLQHREEGKLGPVFGTGLDKKHVDYLHSVVGAARTSHRLMYGPAAHMQET